MQVHAKFGKLLQIPAKFGELYSTIESTDRCRFHQRFPLQVDGVEAYHRHYGAHRAADANPGAKMSSITNYPHISVDETGTARIGKTRYTVMHLATEHYHYGWTAEELLRQHADLKPEEVYAALTYFYDHHARMVVEMERLAAEAETYRAAGNLSRSELLARQDRGEDESESS
jgi:uncharacterized protein (DUF433 family)